MDKIRNAHDKFFVKIFSNTENIRSFLNYIVSIKDIKPDELIKILKESEIQGGEIMPSLAQRWMEQGFEQGVEEGKMETAKELIKNGVSIDIITRSTGIPKKELEKIAQKSH